MTLIYPRGLQLPQLGKLRRDDMLDTYPPGRRCLAIACSTYLHRYNPGPLCELHAERIRAKMADEECETIEELEELMVA